MHSASMDATAILIEVDHPICIPSGSEQWFDVTVSYTPVSVARRWAGGYLPQRSRTRLLGGVVNPSWMLNVPTEVSTT